MAAADHPAALLDALDRFRNIYNDAPSLAKDRGRITEADTRANVLDRIIHEVLGWPRTSVKREPFANPGFIDYQFINARPVLLMEAKSEGEAFVLPYRKHPRRRMKLSGTLCTNNAIDEAIVQVQKYCSDTGVRFGVATNGYTFIIFKAIVEGSRWKNGDAVVFHSFNDIVDDFTTFWNSLSYEAVIDGKLEAAFRQHGIAIREFNRPISTRIDADATFARNPLRMLLTPYVDSFFGDIAKQNAIEILQTCYVFSRPIQRIDEDLGLVIKDQVPQFARGAEQLLPTHLDESGALGRHLRQVTTGSRKPGSVVILLGGIGSGKSTYYTRFFKVVAPDLVAETGPAMHLHLDFLGAPDNASQLDELLWQSLSKAIRSAEPRLATRPYLEVLFEDQVATIISLYGDAARRDDEIARELRESLSNPRVFSEAALRYCVANSRLPVAVFDNVDQLGIESQIQIFTASHHIAYNFGCLSLLVLREESYSTAQMKKHLTAYTVKVYHLSSPRFKSLLKLRVDKAANAASALATTATATPEQVNYAEIVDLFRLLRKSLLGRNANIIRLVESVAYGNMRLALKLFNNFITSGATNIPKIIEYYRRGINYSVPFHEFAKSIILGDYKFYKEDRSPIINMFNVTHHPNASHFTAIRILKYLSLANAAKDGGFSNIHEMLGAITDIFKNEEDCVATLLRMATLERQLVELDTRRTDSLEGAGTIRITSAGQYYLDYLVQAFAYVDIVWHDTPFADRGTADTLNRAAGAASLHERFDRVNLFIDYLQGQENEELTRCGLDLQATAFWGPFMQNIRVQIEAEKREILRRSRRNRRTRDQLSLPPEPNQGQASG